jgi:hypothetical protein
MGGSHELLYVHVQPLDAPLALGSLFMPFSQALPHSESG